MRFISIFLPPLWLEWLEYFVSIFFPSIIHNKQLQVSWNHTWKENKGIYQFDLWISMYDPVFSKILFYCQEGNISPDETTELWRFRGVRGSTRHCSRKWDDFLQVFGGFSSSPGGVSHCLFSIWKLCSFCWNLELFKVWKFFTFHFLLMEILKLFFFKRRTSFGILWIWKCSVLFAGGICLRNHPDFVFLMRSRKWHTEEIGDWDDEHLFDPILGGGFEDLYFHPYLGKISNLMTDIFQIGWNNDQPVF